MLGVIASMSIAVSSCGESDSDEPASGNHAFTVDNVDFDSGRNYCALMPSIGGRCTIRAVVYAGNLMEEEEYPQVGIEIWTKPIDVDKTKEGDILDTEKYGDYNSAVAVYFSSADVSQKYAGAAGGRIVFLSSRTLDDGYRYLTLRFEKFRINKNSDDGEAITLDGDLEFMVMPQ